MIHIGILSLMILATVLVSLPGPVGGMVPDERNEEGAGSRVTCVESRRGVGPTADSSPVTSPAPSVAPAESSPAPPAGEDSAHPVLRGVATWYDWRPGEAAAGPGLRRFLGEGWRGMVVRVSSGSREIVVTLTDWCGCPGGRIVDLDRRSFAVLAPPSRGVLQVEVRKG